MSVNGGGEERGRKRGGSGKRREEGKKEESTIAHTPHKLQSLCQYALSLISLELVIVGGFHSSSHSLGLSLAAHRDRSPPPWDQKEEGRKRSNA